MYKLVEKWKQLDIPKNSNLLSGKKILFMLPNKGNVIQEVMNVAAILQKHGAKIAFACLHKASVHFDPLCNVLALLECLWSPTLLNIFKMRANKSFSNILVFNDMNEFYAIADQFDGLIVPGGHGSNYSDFINDSLLHRICHYFINKNKIIGIECHSVILLSLIGAIKDKSLAENIHLTCWPHKIEAISRKIPVVGKYLSPFNTTVEYALRKTSAIVHNPRLPWFRPHAVINNNIVTSWGPWSTKEFAFSIIYLLARL